MVRRASGHSPRRRPSPPPQVEWPGEVLGYTRDPRNESYRRVHLELDVEHERYRPPPVSLLAPLASLLREREVEDVEDLLTMTAQVLRAFSAAGYREVDHWEAQPGGWLPLPERTHARLAEPVAHLLRALADETWAPIGQARQFAARLSSHGGPRLDFVVRRLHRERVHALSVDLWGGVTRRSVEALVAQVHAQLPLVRAEVVTKEPAVPPVRRRRA